jgi:hypothetical protein
VTWVPDLVVVVPSRERPQAAAELAATFQDTCRAETLLVFALDHDDPTFTEYADVVMHYPRVGLNAQQDGTMVSALNKAAREILREYAGLFAVGFMGDDHRPRTLGWDTQFLDALWTLGVGMVYGNDLLQGENLATHVAMTASIPTAIGYMAPPGLTHMYVDNFWMALGQHVGLTYLPYVIIEHMHPLAGKADWDPGYRRVNAQEMYARDLHAFSEYLWTDYLNDIRKVKAMTAGPEPESTNNPERNAMPDFNNDTVEANGPDFAGLAERAVTDAHTQIEAMGRLQGNFIPSPDHPVD